MTPQERREIDDIIAGGSRARAGRAEGFWRSVGAVVALLGVLAACGIGLRNCAHCYSDAGARDVRCAGAFANGAR